MLHWAASNFLHLLRYDRPLNKFREPRESIPGYNIDVYKDVVSSRRALPNNNQAADTRRQPFSLFLGRIVVYLLRRCIGFR